MTTTTTWGDVAAAAAAPASSEATLDRPCAHTRVRAREYRSLPVVGKIRDLFAVVWADLRSAWWTPASLPTLARAWADRMPDRDRVPGGNAVLYGGWVVYQHTVALAVPAAVLAVVGVLTPLVWAARHPARLALTVVPVTAVVALIVK